MRPTKLFDTELGGRLAGYPRVGLGPLVENVLGFALEKGHSAADWSTRPLPEPWLRYAALDVEVLVELRDAHRRATSTGRASSAGPRRSSPRSSPLPRRRPGPTPGAGRPACTGCAGRRGMGAVRALWETPRRSRPAARDVAPGRILPDTAIVEAALAAPDVERGPAQGARLLGAGHPPPGRPLVRGASLRQRPCRTASSPTSRWPATRRRPHGCGPTETRPPRRGCSAARTAVAALADEHRLPVENLLAPDTVRRLCWTPPERPHGATRSVPSSRAHGARRWQVELTAPVLARALQRVRTKGSA